MKKTLCLILFAVLLAAPMFAGNESKAEKVEVEKSEAFGEEIVTELWSMFAEGNIDLVEKHMSEGFQSIHQDGARDKQTELELLKGLDLSDYKLSDFNTTRHGGIYIVTYMIVVAETIDGESLEKNKAARMSIFERTNDGWIWLAHANLNPM
jgi:hypothetical protein